MLTDSGFDSIIAAAKAIDLDKKRRVEREWKQEQRKNPQYCIRENAKAREKLNRETENETQLRLQKDKERKQIKLNRETENKTELR